MDGKEILERKFKQHSIRYTSENLSVLEKFYKMPSATELYFRIAKGKIDLTKLREVENKNGTLQAEKRTVKKTRKNTDAYSKVNTKKDTILIGDDYKNIDYNLAICCNPIPGDSVFGFTTISDGIKIHRHTCPNAEHLQSKMAYRCIKATWKNSDLRERLADITIHGIDCLGMVNRLTEILSNQQNVNMKSISFDTNDGIFEGKMKVLVFDTEHLDQLMHKFEQVEGVQRVERKP